MGLHFYVKNKTTGNVVCLQGIPSEYGLDKCEILAGEEEYRHQRNSIYTKAIKSTKK